MQVSHEASDGLNLTATLAAQRGSVTAASGSRRNIGRPTWHMEAAAATVGYDLQNIGADIGLDARLGHSLWVYSSVRVGALDRLFGELRAGGRDSLWDPGLLTLHLHYRDEGKRLSAGTGFFGRSMPLYSVNGTLPGGGPNVVAKTDVGSAGISGDGGVMLDGELWFDKTLGLRAYGLLAGNWWAGVGFVVALDRQPAVDPARVRRPMDRAPDAPVGDHPDLAQPQPSLPVSPMGPLPAGPLPPTGARDPVDSPGAPSATVP